MQMKEYYNKQLKERLYYGTHESGLNVYVLPKKGYSKKYAVFATKYGSIDSAFIVPGEEAVTHVPDGIAHFLEHKLFEEQTGNVFDKFAKYGASPNAFTSFNATAYLFSCTDYFYENLDILLQFVQNPYFTDENVQKEQGIIAQEINMYNDDANWRVFFNFLEALYHHHPVKIDIAGTVESISKIDKEILYKCYHTFYHPSNMALFITGEIEVEKILEHVDKYIKKEYDKRDAIERIYPKEPNTIYKKETTQTLSVATPLFQMGFKDNDIGYGGKALLKKEICTHITLEMLMGKSTTLYQDLYEQGLINDTFQVDYTGEEAYGYTIFGGESENPHKVKQQIMAHIKTTIDKGADRQAFERVKKVMLSRYIRQFNSVERLANTFIASLFRDINLFDYMDVYNEITFEEIEKRLRTHFVEENMVLSIVSSQQA